MSLTKQDLSAITNIVQTETRKIVKDELAPVNKRIGGLDKRIGGLDKKIDRNFVFLKKRFDELFDFLDVKYLQVKREVREVQEHLRLPISDF